MADMRRAELEAAQDRALALFEAIEAGGLVAAGRTELEVDEAILALAERDFGVERHWHKRVVRAGPNTVTTFGDNPDIRTIGPDDNVYIDLGPVFEAWEADIGRTYALGDDVDRRRMVADLPRVFDKVQAHYRANPQMSGADLYAFAQAAAAESGWVFGGHIAGHTVGEFSHLTWPGERNEQLIWPRNPAPMNGPDHLGRERNWILEIHLVDEARSYGGFFEQLL